MKMNTGYLLFWSLFWACAAHSNEAINLLSNGDFATPSHKVGSYSQYTGPSHLELNQPGGVPGFTFDHHGISGADSWVYWLSTAGTLNTRLLPSTLVEGGSMIEVETDGGGNGLVQVFSPIDTGPDEVTACVWIYVEQGEVGIATGNGGDTHVSAKISPTGRWERVQIGNAVSPANEIIIYSTTSEGARFYVESARVTTALPGDDNCQPE